MLGATRMVGCGFQYLMSIQRGEERNERYLFFPKKSSPGLCNIPKRRRVMNSYRE